MSVSKSKNKFPLHYSSILHMLCDSYASMHFLNRKKYLKETGLLVIDLCLQICWDLKTTKTRIVQELQYDILKGQCILEHFS